MGLSLFIFLTGFSGVLIGYMLGNKKLNRMIPIAFMSIVLTLYIFGLADHLRVGVVFVDLLILLTYLVFLCWFLLHRKEFWLHFKVLFPCFAIWGFIFLILNFCDIGMMAHNWDEFSHWADTVKIMTYLDDFATGPNSPSLFKSYPPAMSLLQYFFQRNKMWIKGDNLFTDWRLYLTYHVFAVSMVFPCFDREEKAYKKAIKILLTVFACVLFYAKMLESLYIDPFIAILGGYALLSIIIKEKKDKFDLLGISLACVCLTLAKDIGLYFALIVGIVFLADYCHYSIRQLFSLSKLYGFIPIISAFASKFLWKMELSQYDLATKKGMHVNLREYFNMLFFKNGTDYKQEVVNSAIHALFERRVELGLFTTSYFVILVSCLLAAVISCIRYYKRDRLDKKKTLVVGLSLFMMVFLYTLFIGAIYVYGFSEYEATNLASYERYMNIPFLILSLVTIYMLLDSFNDCINDINLIACVAIIVGVLFGSNTSIYRYLSRTDAESSKSITSGYELIQPTIWYYCNPDARIYFVSIGDVGIDHLIAGYYVRPYCFLNQPWSIGGPYYEGDIWSEEISSEDWMNQLIETSDYVYIHKVEDGFIEEYGECFFDPDSITPDSLYKIDEESRVLIKV